MWGHTRKGTDARKQRKSGKQLLTLLTPVVFPPFLFGKVDLLNPAITSASIPKQELYVLSYHLW
jgi:hypothetical protein